MKIILSSYALFFFIQVTFSQVTDGLVASYSANGDATDASETGADGTLMNGTAYGSDNFGNNPGSFSFDGVDDYVDISDLTTYVDELTTGSISFWFSPSEDDLESKQQLMSIANTDQRFATLYATLHSSSQFSFMLWKTYSSSDRAWGIQCTSITFEAEQWYHVTITHDGTEPKLYINGEDVGETFGTNNDLDAWIADIDGTTNSFFVGSHVNGSDLSGYNFFNGRIDEFKVFNRALSAAEVSEVYTEFDVAEEDQSGEWLLSEDNVLYSTNGVAIGSKLVGNHKLAVDGSIGAREIKVELGDWSDFVFENDYKLKPLNEVENFITRNKHLPEIPSEAEVLENGIELGEMNSKLLQKIEELTLYLIDQNKQNQAQQELIESQSEMIKHMQLEIDNLKNK